MTSMATIKVSVEYGLARKLLSLETEKVDHDTFLAVSRLFSLNTQNILLQKFDTDFDCFLDLQLGDDIADKSKLKCILQEPSAIEHQLPEQSVDLSTISVTGCFSPTLTSSPSTSGRVNVAKPANICSTVCGDLVAAENKMSDTLQVALASSCVLTWSLKHELLMILGDIMYKQDKYPDKTARQKLAQSLITKYPGLRERLGTGFDGWEKSIDNVIKAKRRADTSLAVTLLRTKRPKHVSLVDNCIKKARRGELDWQPEMPASEDAESIERHKQVMKKEFAKNEQSRDSKLLETLMDVTYSSRRVLINSNAPVSKVLDEYPGLFSVHEIRNEFRRLVHVNSKQDFVQGLARCARKVVLLAQSKKKVCPEVKSILQRYE
jgi:hypothetical protein